MKLIHILEIECGCILRVLFEVNDGYCKQRRDGCGEQSSLQLLACFAECSVESRMMTHKEDDTFTIVLPKFGHIAVFFFYRILTDEGETP